MFGRSRNNKHRDSQPAPAGGDVSPPKDERLLTRRRFVGGLLVGGAAAVATTAAVAPKLLEKHEPQEVYDEENYDLGYEQGAADMENYLTQATEDMDRLAEVMNGYGEVPGEDVEDVSVFRGTVTVTYGGETYTLNQPILPKTSERNARDLKWNTAVENKQDPGFYLRPGDLLYGQTQLPNGRVVLRSIKYTPKFMQVTPEEGQPPYTQHTLGIDRPGDGDARMVARDGAIPDLATRMPVPVR